MEPLSPSSQELQTVQSSLVMRERVLANVTDSQAARAASRFAIQSGSLRQFFKEYLPVPPILGILCKLYNH